jgi:hypothetical protein
LGEKIKKVSRKRKVETVLTSVKYYHGKAKLFCFKTVPFLFVPFLLQSHTHPTTQTKKVSPPIPSHAMVWKALRKAVGFAEPSLPDDVQPTRLAQYFPVEPKVVRRLPQSIQCLLNEAAAKARDMERVGYYQPYFDDLSAVPTQLATQVPETVARDLDNPEFPHPNDNPLDECLTSIAQYQYCCGRKLKQRKIGC